MQTNIDTSITEELLCPNVLTYAYHFSAKAHTYSNLSLGIIWHSFTAMDIYWFQSTVHIFLYMYVCLETAPWFTSNLFVLSSPKSPSDDQDCTEQDPIQTVISLDSRGLREPAIATEYEIS